MAQLRKFTGMRGSIAVFCGSSKGARPEYAAAARLVAHELYERDLRLVYGAGSVGLMGVVANEMLKLGGEVLGVIPQFLMDLEVGHGGLTELLIAESMHERKLIMANNSEGFLALPGGIGTLEEIVEVFTWTQLGVHRKNCALLNVDGYYDDLLGMVGNMVSEQFLKEGQASQLLVDTDPGRLIDALLGEAPPPEPKWIGR